MWIVTSILLSLYNELSSTCLRHKQLHRICTHQVIEFFLCFSSSIQFLLQSFLVIEEKQFQVRRKRYPIVLKIPLVVVVSWETDVRRILVHNRRGRICFKESVTYTCLDHFSSNFHVALLPLKLKLKVLLYLFVIFIFEKFVTCLFYSCNILFAIPLSIFYVVFANRSIYKLIIIIIEYKFFVFKQI